jgi:hypothetical protein
MELPEAKQPLPRPSHYTSCPGNSPPAKLGRMPCWAGPLAFGLIWDDSEPDGMTDFLGGFSEICHEKRHEHVVFFL